MSNTKTVMGQASNQYVKPLDITDVFSTYLYDGTGSAQTITNDIDLAGEGGLVWLKERTSVGALGWHSLFDTERGTSKYLSSNNTNAEASSAGVTAFNSNGFTLGTTNLVNQNTGDFASWTFRKAPKFFDVVTYTGNRVNTSSFQDIPHNLGSTPGMIIVKETSSADDWMVYHRSVSVDGTVFKLNTTDAATNFGNVIFDVSEINDSTFRVGNMNNVNANGSTYVAYLFAHNDGDGEFGPNGDQDIIKCGSYTGNNGLAHHVELGFEPQWLLVKNADLGTPGAWWSVVDDMRGLLADTSIKVLKANESEAEINENGFTPTATGFTVSGNNDFQNNSTNTYIYIAIRRGPLAQPESGTEVFSVVKTSGVSSPTITTGFPTDLHAFKTTDVAQGAYWASRLTNRALISSETSSETSAFNLFDSNTTVPTSVGSTGYVHYDFRRAPGFCDVVAYTGTNIPGLTINHNLGVVPEMIWVKNRSAAEYWAVYHKDLNGGTNPSHYYLKLNDTIAETDYNEIWNDTEPTATQFTVGQQGVVNGFEQNHIAYLFATVPGVSKVGSYTGNGTSQTIDCGFTSGARFVLIKGTSSSGFNWNVYDTARGIVAGNDSRLSLDTTFAEVSVDEIDPHSSGFSVTSAADVNMSGQSYIFYAIA